jgi:uncharacterized DUF497 family protein
VEVDWDVAKNDFNQKKHDLSFGDASELFRSGDYLELFDEAHSAYEDRFIAIGPISAGSLSSCSQRLRTKLSVSSVLEWRPSGRSHCTKNTGRDENE